MNFRTLIPLASIFTGFISVILILWDQEFKNYVAIGDSSDLAINSKLDLNFLSESKPAYLHFFSEDCKSARVNLTHFSRIISKYDEDVDFYVINASTLDVQALRQKYRLPKSVQIVDDSDGKLTKSLHVKSLPYALISTTDNRLFFGGNYNNQNGLCGSSEIIWSSPAVALKFLIEDQNPPLFPSYQVDFIGCGT